MRRKRRMGGVRRRRAVVIGRIRHIIGRRLVMRRGLAVEVGLLRLVVLWVLLIMRRWLLVRWLLVVRRVVWPGRGRRDRGENGRGGGGGVGRRRRHLPSWACLLLLLELVVVVRRQFMLRGVVVWVRHVFGPAGMEVEMVRGMEGRGIRLHHRQGRRG